ncbi:phospholipase D-like domain-containing protein [Jannaschia ovalis]|uniref:Phospholipase D n=1 Tax=Jannaschia ovalis TaxID=3038773 RepID=A0ABY8L7A1_9RHOB|nr:phospholipase D-like domain-containing protein [Jannaschia sp. GRR-S6-38]WGH77259.1 phospholipase D-like domain-containing protein [Jannaschia sp. GRR-S6-38]
MDPIFDLPLWLRAVLLVGGLAGARAALSTARTPQGAAAWVVFLLAWPLVALPLFMVFGGVSRINQKPDHRHLDDTGDDARPARLGRLRGVTHARLSAGNELHLLIDGGPTFDAIFPAIDAARTELLVQFYILRRDAVGLELRDRMIAAAERGVRVYVLLDLIGSLTLGPRYIHELREAGINVRGVPGRRSPRGRIGLNFRNHRKTVVVDGRVGFTGGINAAQEYVDGGKHYDAWRDTHLQIEGPMVAQLRDLFAADWEAVTRETLPPLEAPDWSEAGGRLGLVTGFGPTDAQERGSLLLCALVGLAQRRLWIATPYLVPHTDLLTALQLAQLRGVDVRILIPRPADKWVTWYATRGFAREFARVGIDVLQYEPGFMHQKVMLIDDEIASVGTINLDIRSALLNFEETALVEDAGFAAEVEAMLTRDFARAAPLPDPPPRHIRALAPVARLFGPLL